MKLTPLHEITYSDAPRVDREAGVIRGVRILGRVSRNGREYSSAALAQAARLYEGLGVNLNHSERRQSDGARDVEDGFGWLEGIDVRPDGVYGDLHYFRAHPQADVIVEAALRNPNAGEVLVSAAPGWEFVDLAGRHHLGGGSHGSLEPADSEVPMLTVGLGEPPASITGIKPLVVEHLLAAERAA